MLHARHSSSVEGYACNHSRAFPRLHPRYLPTGTGSGKQPSTEAQTLNLGSQSSYSIKLTAASPSVQSCHVVQGSLYDVIALTRDRTRSPPPQQHSSSRTQASISFIERVSASSQTRALGTQATNLDSTFQLSRVLHWCPAAPGIDIHRELLLYQLLSELSHFHSQGHYHGSICPEQVWLTTTR